MQQCNTCKKTTYDGIIQMKIDGNKSREVILKLMGL